MGYDHIVRVASDSIDTTNWEVFRTEYLSYYGDQQLGLKQHGCDVPKLGELFAEISHKFPDVHLRFYHFYFDYEGLTIYEFLGGECMREYYCSPPDSFLVTNGFVPDEFVWNPELGIHNDVTEYFLPEE